MNQLTPQIFRHTPVVLGLCPALALAQQSCGWSDAPSVLELDGPIASMLVHDDGSGPALYAAGDFQSLDNNTAQRIARWDGAAWTQVGDGLDAEVFDLLVFDAGDGPKLYAAGSYGLLGQSTLAAWNGATWQEIPGTPNVWIGALGQSTVGGVPELYISGPTTNYVHRWDGSTWRTVGSGLEGVVWSFTEYDDGTGTALYAAGGLDALYAFDGTDWEAVGGNFSINNVVESLAVYNDGTENALYLGGRFTRVPGFLAALGVAKWNGTHWSALGDGFTDTVLDLAVFDDGSGPALYAAGEFTHSGNTPLAHIARWDGAAWQPLGQGTDAEVTALYATEPDHNGQLPNALYLGGLFVNVDTIPSPSFAAFLACICPADFNNDGSVNTLDVLLFLNAWNAGEGAADFNADGAINTLDVLDFLNAWNTGCDG